MKTGTFSPASRRIGKRTLSLLCALFLVVTMLPVIPLSVTAAENGGLYEGWRHISYDYLDTKETAAGYISYNADHSITVDAMGSEGEFLYLNRLGNDTDNVNSGSLNLRQFGADEMENFVIEFDVKLEDFDDKDLVNKGIPGVTSPAGLGLVFAAQKPNSLYTSSVMAQIDYSNVGFLSYDYPDSEWVNPYDKHFNYVTEPDHSCETCEPNQTANVKQYHWMYNYAATPHVTVTKIGSYLCMDVTNGVGGNSYRVEATLDTNAFATTGFIGLAVQRAKATFRNVKVTSYADNQLVRAERTFFAPDSAEPALEGWTAVDTVDYRSNLHVFDKDGKLSFGPEWRSYPRSEGGYIYTNNNESKLSLNNAFHASYTANELAEGIALTWATTDIDDYLYLNIGNADAVLPDGNLAFYDYYHGTGLKLMAKTDETVKVSLVTDEGTVFTDTANVNLLANNWQNEVSIGKTNDKWYLTANGTDLLATMTVQQQNALTALLNEDGYFVFGCNNVKDNPDNQNIYRRYLYLNADSDSNWIFAPKNMENFTISYDVKVNACSTDANGAYMGAVSLSFMGQENSGFENANIQARVDQNNIGFMWRSGNNFDSPYEAGTPDWTFVDGRNEGYFQHANRNNLFAPDSTFHVTVTKAGQALTMTVTAGDATVASINSTLDEANAYPNNGLGYIGFSVENASVAIRNISVKNDTANEEILYFTPAPTGDGSHTHQWNAANCSSPAYCAICGAAKGEALGHVWTGDGTNKKCQRNCGMSLCEAEGHAPVLVPAITPTTTKDGRTAGSKCSVCNADIAKGVVIPKLTMNENGTLTLIAFSEGDANSHIPAGYTITGGTDSDDYGIGGPAMQSLTKDVATISLYRKPGEIAANAIAFYVNVPAATTTFAPYLVETVNGEVVEYHRPYNNPNSYTEPAYVYLQGTDKTITEIDLSQVYDSRNIFPAGGFTGWVIYPLDVFQSQETIIGNPESGLELNNVTKIMLDYATTESFAVDSIVALQNLNAFLENKELHSGQHNWVYGENENCTNAHPHCSGCGVYSATVTHLWDGTACSICKADLMDVAENFNDKANLIDVDNNNHEYVYCTGPFGTALNYFRTTHGAGSNESGINKVKIALERAGLASDEALVFRFDSTTSGWSSDASMQVMLHAGKTTISMRNPSAVDFPFYYYLVNGKTVTKRTASEISKVLIPQDACGWIILPLPQKQGVSISQDGQLKDATQQTMEGIDAVTINFEDYNYAAVTIDQIGFTKDADAFAKLAAENETVLPDYTTDRNHNWTNDACADCGLKLFDIRTDNEKSASYTAGVVGNVCGNPFGDAATFSYNAAWSGKPLEDLSSYDFISFGSKGSANDQALAFYYDATNNIQDVDLRFAPVLADGANATTLEKGYPITTIVDGDKKPAFNSNAVLTLPAGTKGWVLIDLQSNSAMHWTLLGQGPHTNQYIGGVALAVTTADTEAVIDQLGFVRDVNAFVALAANEASVPGYNLKPFHNWENGLCTRCQHPQLIECIGTSVKEGENTLRFGFMMQANGVTVKGYSRVDMGTIAVGGETYELVDFGAIVANKDYELTLEQTTADATKNRVKNIQAKKIFSAAEDFVMYACGITNIPKGYEETWLYARGYYIYKDKNGKEIVIYGDRYKQSIANYNRDGSMQDA